MKRTFFTIAAAFTALTALSGCAKPTDYLTYVSEKRENIYLYSDDGLEIKIYSSVKETPFSADGIKGEMCGLCEIFVTLPKNCNQVDISAGEIEGEMSYRSVENMYYLSYTGEIKGDSVEVTVTTDGESAQYMAVSVLYDGVISCDEAVRCVLEREAELIENMTENGIFCGEIFVRLLYDDGCYYYVGICNREKKINAFLVDGERGKIIATRELQG